MTDRELAEQFEKLHSAYKNNWLVRDTEAFKYFCFAHSEQIANMLKRAVEPGR